MSLDDKATIVIIGRSGSGKGTQAKFIARKLKPAGVKHLETGRFIRNLLKKSNPTTEIANQLMQKGDLTPSWFAAFTWLKEIIEKGAAGKNLVFDGAPRKIWEAELLDEVMIWHKRPLPFCVYVEVSQEEAYRRLMLRRRADDNPDAIRNRLSFFNTDVLPVIDYYAERGRIVVVDGERNRKKIFSEIDQKLSEKIGDSWGKSVSAD